jgi:hypothetical protein
LKRKLQGKFAFRYQSTQSQLTFESCELRNEDEKKTNATTKRGFNRGIIQSNRQEKDFGFTDINDKKANSSEERRR